MARMRALENGRYLIRGTNNGVSAIVNHRGQVVAETAQFEETSLLGKAEVMLGNTPVGSFGSLPVIVSCFSILLLMVLMQLTLWRSEQAT